MKKKKNKYFGINLNKKITANSIKTVPVGKKESFARNVFEGTKGILMLFVFLLLITLCVIAFLLCCDKFNVSNKISFVICYGIPLILLFLLFKIMVYWIKFAKRKKENISVHNVDVSPFVKICENIYTINYLIVFTIFCSRNNKLISFLSVQYKNCRWLLLANVVCVILSMFYCCLDNREIKVGYSEKKGQCLGEKEYYIALANRSKNQTGYLFLAFFTIISLLFCNGYKLSSNFLKPWVIITILLTLVQVRMIRRFYDSNENNKTKKNSSVVSGLIFLGATALFVGSSILYTNQSFNVHKEKTFSTILHTEDFRYHHSTKGGDYYSVNITDDDTNKTYSVNISRETYYRCKGTYPYVKVDLYEGLWGIEWVEWN